MGCHLGKATEKFKAAVELDDTLNLDDLETEARQLYVETLVQQGRDLARAGQLGEATEKFKAAVELDDTLNLDDLETEAR